MANQHQDTPFYKESWFLVLSTVVLIVVINKNYINSSGNASSIKADEIEESYIERHGDFIITEINTDRDMLDNYIITGKIKNISDSEKSYVEVKFQLLNNMGEIVGDAMDNITGLPGNRTWSFKAIGVDDNAITYKLQHIRGRE